MDAQVKAYLMKKLGYSDDLSDESLKNAMAQSKDGQLMAGLSRAGATVGAALGGIKPDSQFYDQMNAQANAPIADIFTRRKAQADDLAYQNAQIAHQQMANLHDPNSLESQVLRKTWEAALPGIDKAYGDEWQNITAADKDIVLKPMEFKERQIERRDMKNMMLQQHQNETYNKAMSETVDKIEQSKTRGAVKNAWEAERLVNNAKSILDAYPDLNQMPSQQVALLVDELGKIARGGAATEGSQHALMPNTITSQFMSGLSKLGNAPKGAELGEFLKGYGNYLDDLKKNARATIGQSIKSTLMGHKNRLRPEDHDSIAQNYADYLNPSTEAPKLSGSNRIRVSNGKEHYDILPEDLIHAQKEGFKVVSM